MDIDKKESLWPGSKAAAITDVMSILKAELASDSEPLARLHSSYH